MHGSLSGKGRSMDWERDGRASVQEQVRLGQGTGTGRVRIPAGVRVGCPGRVRAGEDEERAGGRYGNRTY